jgi:formylglycine-generating enzyme required for sulfatase activity
VAQAIRTSRWDDALSLAPNSVAALVGRARAKLAARPPDIDGAFADLERAEKLSPGSADVKVALGTAHATRATDHARGDQLAEAAQGLAEAVGLNGDAQAIAAARVAIVAAWLERADKAIDKNDASLVQIACDAALKAGAKADAVSEPRARGMIMEALRMWDRGESKTAMEKVIAAIETNASAGIEALRSSKLDDLRKHVVNEYRKQFDASVAKDAWTEAMVASTVAAQIDPEAASWLKLSLTADKLRGLSPTTLATLSPALLAALPAATLSSLPPDTIRALPSVRNSLGVELRLLPAGSFTMGDAAAGWGNKPHRVTLTRPFYMGVHELTNAQWKRVMGSVPSNWKDGDQPVENVSWEDAVEFCGKLSALPEERTAGRVYRLPTEAEWEYACRAGTTTQYSFGDDEARLGDYGWFNRNSGSKTHAVGQKMPNAWGLYDMHGNVWEWCSDWYGSYSDGAVTNPQGLSSGSNRVNRGGSWDNSAGLCWSAYRVRLNPSLRNYNLGFRLALSPSGAESPEAGK